MHSSNVAWAKLGNGPSRRYREWFLNATIDVSHSEGSQGDTARLFEMMFDYINTLILRPLVMFSSTLQKSHLRSQDKKQ